jgi:hypothetical protein
VSSGSRARPPDKEGSGAITCTVAPNPLGGLWRATYPVASDPASLRGGLWAITHPAVPCGSQASSMKKSLADLLVRQGSYVPNARAHISKTSDVMVIMGLQDVRAGTTDNAYKTCGHAATVQRHHY